MAERKDREVIHLKLGEKDADIVYWKDSIPNNSFTWYVREILAAEKNKYVAAIPVPDKTGLVYRRVDVRLYFTEKAEIQLIRSIPKGKRASEIKKIIRKHLRLNYSAKGKKGENEQTDEEIIPVQHEEQPEPTEIKEADTASDLPANDVSEDDENDEVSEEYRNMLKGLFG